MKVEPPKCEVLKDSIACSNASGEADALLRLRFIAEGTAAATGEAFFSGTTWRGKRAMRVSVVNWRTTEEDVRRTVAAVASVLHRDLRS